MLFGRFDFSFELAGTDIKVPRTVKISISNTFFLVIVVVSENKTDLS